jgi:hypothetical protein
MSESRSDLGETDSGPNAGGEANVDLFARGTAVDRYVVLERLGAGGMGVVYAAYDPDLDRKVAIKFLRPQGVGGNDDRRRARLQREAQAIAKLSHPNVVSIFDVGVHDGQVFLAMEHLPGGTLARWLTSKKRSWREILETFVEIGHGLAAAHAEGLVHRDFKPDNVLLDRQDKPKVVDFGLVRLSAPLDESTSSPGQTPVEGPPITPAVAAFAGDLTRTGAMAGTPAYMAPEQFLGQPVSAQSDQFAYCVALFEALYGVRPFQGENVLLLAEAVLAHRLTPPPPNAAVPPWVRRVIERGLAVKPEARFPTMAELVRQLDRRPINLKKAAAVGGVGVAVAAALVIVTSVVGGRARARAEIEATTRRTLDEATRFAGEASEGDKEGARLRVEALRLFDEGSGLLPGGAQEKSWARAEERWAAVLELEAAAETAYGRAAAALDTALFIDPRRTDVRDRLAQVLGRRLMLAGRTFKRERETELEQRMVGLRRTGTAIPVPTARLVIRLPAASERTRHGNGRTLCGRSLRAVAGGPGADVARRPAARAPTRSYLVVASTAGGAAVRLPALLDRDRLETITVPPVKQWAVPPEMVFVIEGDALIGSDEENVRTALDVPPLHRVHVGAFLIGRHEVTFAEYIAWLDSLAPPERARRTPRSTSSRGVVALQFAPDGTWTLTLATDQPRIPGGGRATDSLSRAPDTSRPGLDAVPGQRDLVRGCTGLHALAREIGSPAGCPRLQPRFEWERAGRGADGRMFTTGRRLLPTEANFDVTYGARTSPLVRTKSEAIPNRPAPSAWRVCTATRRRWSPRRVGTRLWPFAEARGFGIRVQQRLDNRFRHVPFTT